MKLWNQNISCQYVIHLEWAYVGMMEVMYILINLSQMKNEVVVYWLFSNIAISSALLSFMPRLSHSIIQPYILLHTIVITQCQCLFLSTRKTHKNSHDSYQSFPYCRNNVTIILYTALLLFSTISLSTVTVDAVFLQNHLYF